MYIGERCKNRHDYDYDNDFIRYLDTELPIRELKRKDLLVDFDFEFDSF